MRKSGFILVFMSLIIMLVFSGCAKVDEETISVADGLTENLLISLNNKDYENYKRDLSVQMLEAIPEEEFIKFSSFLDETVGEYVADSKEVSNSGIQNGMSVIVYETDYTNESGKVTVSIVLSETADEGYEISGSWFNSPKIRENSYQ